MISQNELDARALGGTELMGLGLEKRLDAKFPGWSEKFQIIRSRVRELEPNKKHILWLHDLALDPEATRLRNPEFRKQFDALVFVSQWQQDQYHGFLGVPYAEGSIIRNAIDPITEPRVDANGQVRIIYHSTPHRGLQILIPVFEELYKEYKDRIHLEIFSSFKLYGWEERDLPYRELFERAGKHPGMTYRGTQPNSEVRQALLRSDIFAYPSIWQETSCICAIESMAAGCEIICPTFGALTETIGGHGIQYDFHEDMNVHAKRFYDTLRAEIEWQLHASPELIKERAWAARHHALVHYDWNVVFNKWVALLVSLDPSLLSLNAN